MIKMCLIIPLGEVNMRKKRKNIFVLFLLCFLLANGVCEGGEALSGSDELNYEQAAPRKMDRRTSRIGNSEHPLHNPTSRVEDHAGVLFPQRGSGAGPRSLNAGKHFKMKSKGLRWNLARDFGPKIEDKRRVRFKKRKKTESERTERRTHGADEEGSRWIIFSIALAAMCSGILMLSCIVVGFVRVCKNYPKKGFRQSDVELGLKYPSKGDCAKNESKDVATDEFVIKQDTDQPVEQQTMKPPSSHPSATHSNAQGQGTWTLTETMTSTPLMAVPTNANAKADNSIIVEIPEMSSFDNFSSSSAGCSEHDVCKRSSSLTAVKSISSSSDLEMTAPMSTKPSVSASAVPFGKASGALTISCCPTPVQSGDFCDDDVVLPLTSASCNLTTRSQYTVLPTSSNQANPKGSLTLALSSSSDDLTEKVSCTTDNSDSSTQSCKVPVAPRDEVIITIEDDCDEEQTQTYQTKASVMINDVQNSVEKNEERVTIPVTNVTGEVSGVPMNDNQGWNQPVEDGADVMNKHVENTPSNDVSVPVKGNDEVKLVEDKLENNEISDVDDGDQKEGPGANKDVDPTHEADCRRMPEKDESMETEHADKIHATFGGDCENASVMKALMDAIGEFVIVDNYAVPISSLDTWTKITSNERNPPTYDTGEYVQNSYYYNRGSYPMMGTFEDEDDFIAPDENIFSRTGHPWIQEEFGVRGGSKGGPFKNRTPRKEEDGPKVTETQKVEATENSVNSIKISALDHKKNPQVGCTCKYCGKHWKKSHGPKFLKVPRKLVNSNLKSSKCELASEACMTGQSVSVPSRALSLESVAPSDTV